MSMRQLDIIKFLRPLDAVMNYTAVMQSNIETIDLEMGVVVINTHRWCNFYVQEDHRRLKAAINLVYHEATFDSEPGKVTVHINEKVKV